LDTSVNSKYVNQYRFGVLYNLNWNKENMQTILFMDSKDMIFY